MGRLSPSRDHANFSLRLGRSLTFAYRGKTILLQCSRYCYSINLLFTHVYIECDKSFTRSDALAKHMRTVHEIETGKPQDVLAKVQLVPDTKNKRRRSPSFTENGQGEDDLDQRSDADDPELALYSSVNRYRYLKRKLRWATERNTSLRRTLQDAEARKWRNWTQKEALLDRILAKENINLGYQAD